METQLVWWVGFNVLVLVLLALDLGVFHRTAHTVHIKEALIWSGVWVALALLFNLGIATGWVGGYAPPERSHAALTFLTGYLLEKSLRVDNLFVFAMLFSYFSVPPHYQHRVLFWGIIGALLMRAMLIFAGVALVVRFHWILYLFGAILIYSGITMLRKHEGIHPEQNPILRLLRRILPITSDFEGARFFVWRAGKLWVTPLLVILVFIEWTDLVFALDSIPAILAVTHDPFIVYTSNVLAILGLRSLYFALGGLLHTFAYLRYALSVILVAIGIKLLLTDLVEIPTLLSLGVIVTLVAAAIIASILKPPQPVAEEASTSGKGSGNAPERL
jgi:tellurite resistance protein TerC